MTTFTRIWAMPNAETFSVKPIGEFVRRHLEGRRAVLDPFARNTRFGTCTNDISTDTTAQFHMKAVDFLDMLVSEGRKFDAILFDPPYSPRQISECYQKQGLKVAQTDTQLSAMTKQCRLRFSRLAVHGCVCLTFGWQTVSVGPHWRMAEILIVPHGGAHNDTLCTAQIYEPENTLG